MALERQGHLETLDIITMKGESDGIKFGDRTHIYGLYEPERPWSYLNVFNWFRKHSYDVLFVNSFPTSQGNSNLSNLLYLLVPLFVSRAFHTRIIILYHNSPFLTDFASLGYTKTIDKIKSMFLKIIERSMFKTCEVYMLLDTYVKRIRSIVPGSHVDKIEFPYLGGFATLYLNGVLERNEMITDSVHENILTVLLFGFWGPQKDLSTALKGIRLAKQESKSIRCVLAGTVNFHFDSDRANFNNIKKEYSDVLDHIIDYVDTKDMFALFLNSDLVVLPYRTPGGFSAVGAVSSLFDLEIVVPEFDEYLDQFKNSKNVQFMPISFSEINIRDCVLKGLVRRKKSLNFEEKFIEAIAEIRGVLLKNTPQT